MNLIYDSVFHSDEFSNHYSQDCTLHAAQDQLNPLLSLMGATTESDKHLAAFLSGHKIK